MNRWLRRALPTAIVVAVLGGVAYGLWPRPVEVDLGEVTRGCVPERSGHPEVHDERPPAGQPPEQVLTAPLE